MKFWVAIQNVKTTIDSWNNPRNAGLPCKWNSKVWLGTYSYTNNLWIPEMQCPWSDTRCLSLTRLIVSTSAWNSRSPWPLPSFNCLIATTFPSWSTPLWTYPKPPWPRRLVLEKLSVAKASSSYVNVVFVKFKLVLSGADCGIGSTEFMLLPSKVLVDGWAGFWLYCGPRNWSSIKAHKT